MERPTDKAQNASKQPSDFLVRTASALVLIPLALITTYLGGLAFSLFWGVAACIAVHEWSRMCASQNQPRWQIYLPTIIMVLICSLNVFGLQLYGWVLFALGTGLLVALSGLWQAAGLSWGITLGLCFPILRGENETGLWLTIFILVIVWATDICAYLVGRQFGGPKLWPRVSPKKTWSGATGGLVGAILFGLIVISLEGGSASLWAIIAIAALSIISQLGDLAESSTKRLFDIKDSGQIIPGHGGVLDRVDGLCAVLLVLYLWGAIKTDTLVFAPDLMVW